MYLGSNRTDDHRVEMDRIIELAETEITAEELQRRFTLNEHNGKFVRRVDKRGNPLHPSEATHVVQGTKSKDRGLIMSIKGRAYSYHRLVWMYIHGEFPYARIRHINGDNCDNRPGNLIAKGEVCTAAGVSFL